jgi:ribosomal protein S18 acetylase RimI-like enzyme
MGEAAPRFELRPARPPDSAQIDAVVIAAFGEFPESHGEWPTERRNRAGASSLASAGEQIVATVEGTVAGVVTYVGPNIEKQDWFDREWPVIRLLAVDPAYRGLGIGRALTEECIRRAARDGASVIALHTTPMLDVAFAMYTRMGFRHLRDSAPWGPVPYAVYVKPL